MSARKKIVWSAVKCVDLPKAQTKLLIGKVLEYGGKDRKTVKIRALKMVLDDYLKKYFNERCHLLAMDTKQICNIGDLVLIKQLSEEVRKDVLHEVKEKVYSTGDYTDPLTGRKCSGPNYRPEEWPNPIETLKRYAPEEYKRLSPSLENFKMEPIIEKYKKQIENNDNST
ncbi:small ribosomal subunit protein uS17m-like [Tubulanus polymorphus]|uniref:small ribosomal subunit protein uS17m-like n=1 Tax=Tubulanus polymorphus TaxID=672921 RepID=UPI003DA24C76